MASSLSKLREEGVERARLWTYEAWAVAEAAAALGPKARVAVSVPDDEVADASAPGRVCAAIASYVRAGTVDLVVVGVTPPSGVGADVARTAALANATITVAAACAHANASVAVSTSFSLSVLRSSFPPSDSWFANPGSLGPILRHLRATQAPFVIELDPYLAWRQSYYDINKEYATFGSKTAVFVDPVTNVAYWNLYDAMLDAVRWALYQEQFADLDVVVGGVGWPSGSAEAPAPSGATPRLAAAFNSRLARHVNCTSTAVPGARHDADGCASRGVAYIFEADDPAETEEDPLRWGLCAYPSGDLKYSLATGRVLAPAVVAAPDRSFACPRCRPIRAASLALAAALALALLLYSLFSRRPKLFRRHSAHSVATIIRDTRHAAQENLHAARANSLNNHHQKTLSARFYCYGSNHPSALRAIDELVPGHHDSDDSSQSEILLSSSDTPKPSFSAPTNGTYANNNNNNNRARSTDDDDEPLRT